MDVTGAEQVRRSRRQPVRQLVRRLITAIRDNDERQVEEAVLQLAGTRKIFAPLALAAGALVMLFSGLRLLVTNWRLMPRRRPATRHHPVGCQKSACL